MGRPNSGWGPVMRAKKGEGGEGREGCLFLCRGGKRRKRRELLRQGKKQVLG